VFTLRVGTALSADWLRPFALGRRLIFPTHFVNRDCRIRQHTRITLCYQMGATEIGFNVSKNANFETDSASNEPRELPFLAKMLTLRPISVQMNCKRIPR